MARNLKGAVLGLGMIGRHHARILQTAPFASLAGAVDPAGDRHGAVHDADRVFATVEELLARARPDFAVVAVPTEQHLPAVEELTAAGVHVLVEKPLAGSADAARQIIDAVSRGGVRGAVGHVERFNPALLELRRRLPALGDLFLIASVRVGPFPDRIRDVGVVKDLATHDLDLVHWLGGSPVEAVAAQTSHRMGREHEDLVLVTGRLTARRGAGGGAAHPRDSGAGATASGGPPGVPFNCLVDWLTPAKTRRMRVLGEGGMLVADTLTGDLTLFENAGEPIEWAATQQLRGVAEGDMVRFALQRREPLLVELETFCRYVGGDEDAPVVTLEAGLETVLTAEAVLASAASGETVRLVPAS